MTMFGTPEVHAANGPETWTVVNAGNRLWNLTTAAGGFICTYATRKAAEADRESGPFVDLYRKEARWYAGEPVPAWKPWAQVRAEAQRNAAFRLGCRHGRSPAGAPYGDLNDAGSADLMTALGEVDPTTEANHADRVSLLAAYVRGWEKTSGRSYEAGIT